MCRFGGHCRRFYSVAQHSCLLADLMFEGGGDAAASRWALLHDAAEAYLLDLPHPLKHRSELGRLYRAVEAPLQAAIVRRFGLPAEPPATLKALDNELLAAEKAELMPPIWEWPELAGVEAAVVEIDPWPPERARAEFLERFDRFSA
jgi:5'-deoxynucleotidase YfbR-like HD superfamily hydrolase